MKSDRRHELQHNELSDWVGTALDQGRSYANYFLIGGALIALAGIISYNFTSRGRAEKTAAWEQYFAAANGSDEALEAVVRQYAGLEPAQWALLRLADRQLASGMDGMFTDRLEAKKKLKAAIDRFQEVRQQATAGSTVDQRALFGLARAHEALNDLDAARDEYAALTKLDRDGLFAEVAQARVDDLSRQPTRAFYDWFSAQNPQPKPAANASPLGEDFKFESLPDEPLFDGNQSLEGALGSPDASPAPTGDDPAGETPAAEAPAESDPLDQAAGDAPAAEPPAAEAPATETPATEAPAGDAPSTDAAPATEDPATEDPATEDPATEDPATEAPASGDESATPTP